MAAPLFRYSRAFPCPVSTPTQRSPIPSFSSSAKSKLCFLYDKSEEECIQNGECAYDQGGYFIINGGEKVLVSQERQANNKAYCFMKKNGSNLDWTCEVRSSIMCGVKPPISFSVSLLKNEIVVFFHNIREPIPIVTVLKAFGCLSMDSMMEKFGIQQLVLARLDLLIQKLMK